MKAFLTGSRAYGTPREDSDIDLAVLLDEQACGELWRLGLNSEGSVRFGKLNLVTFTKEDNFLRWKSVNDQLVALRPVSRENAIAKFQEAGFGNYPSREQLAP